MADKFDFDATAEKLRTYNNDPQLMLNDMQGTEGLYDAAPNISDALNTTFANTVTFLNSKLPAPVAEYPLSSKWEASRADQARFKTYYDIVNNPIGALEHVKNGSLQNEHLEALSAVYPSLFKQMQDKVVEYMNTDAAKKLPYHRKISLSKFLGIPLDGNVQPANVLANQKAIMQPDINNPQAPKVNAGQMEKAEIGKRAQSPVDRRSED